VSARLESDDALVAARGNLPVFAIAIAVTAWSVGPILVKSIHADAQAVVFFRLWMAVPATYVAMRLTGGRFTWDLARRVVGPATLFAIAIITNFMSFKLTSIANATLIPALQPALILLVAGRLFANERTPRKVALALVAFAGIGAVVLGAGSGGDAAISGDLLATVNLLVFTSYFVWGSRLRAQGVQAFSYLFVVFTWSAIVATPWVLLTTKGLGQVGGWDWLRLVAMVLGPGICGHGLMTWSQRYVSVSTASLMTLANPVMSTIWAWAIFSQRLEFVQLVGAAVVLVALAGIVADHRSTSLVEIND
jgi:drug/metabolite transporter (DMT)-like permease